MLGYITQLLPPHSDYSGRQTRHGVGFPTVLCFPVPRFFGEATDEMNPFISFREEEASFGEGGCEVSGPVP